MKTIRKRIKPDCCKKIKQIPMLVVFCLSEAQLYGLCRSEINYMQGRRRGVGGHGIVDSFAFPKSWAEMQKCICLTVHFFTVFFYVCMQIFMFSSMWKWQFMYLLRGQSHEILKIWFALFFFLFTLSPEMRLFERVRLHLYKARASQPDC